jgi:endonuclease V-like protein UPF0215 family
MIIKHQIRILAIDDSPLINDAVIIIGTYFRGSGQLDGVLCSRITKDGMDATDIIIRMIMNSKYYGQIKVIMLDGITYAGFNPVDISRLFSETGIPVIVFMRSYPDLEKIKLALGHLPETEKRWKIILRAGRIYEIKAPENAAPGNAVFIQFCGMDRESADKIVRQTSIHGNVPEPLRVAHLIATAVVLGESAGRA